MIFQNFGFNRKLVRAAAPSPGPNYVAGASLIYDFGNLASYPGSGTSVYDVSGNGGPTATFVGSPTFSSVTKGGSLAMNSSNYMTYSGQFPAAYTVQAYYRKNTGTSPTYPRIGGQTNNNGVALAIDMGWPASPYNYSGVYQQFYYGASGNTDAGAVNDASALADIQNIFTFFSAQNNGTNAQKYYVNTTIVASATNLNYDRTLFTPSNQTVYIGNETPGTLVAWLVYPFVLSSGDITQNYNIFNAR